MDYFQNINHLQSPCIGAYLIFKLVTFLADTQCICSVMILVLSM